MSRAFRSPTRTGRGPFGSLLAQRGDFRYPLRVTRLSVPGTRLPRTRLFKALLAILFAMGLFWRAAPLADDGRTMSQWPTEDGYFMLTMGRNVGLGRGLSVAGGETPTNGTQPLTTFVWGLGYALLGPAREAGVKFALALQLLASMGTAAVLYALGRRVLRGRDEGSTVAALAAALWFASPVVMPHTMNCLETGFAALMVASIAHAFLWRPRDGDVLSLWPWPRVLAFGALLGLGFWIRNDIAVLIAAACAVYLYPALRTRPEFKPRLARVFAFGATSVLVASPWLVFNVVRFGHVMPVSGRAEALTGHFGGNIAGVPIVVAEYLMGVVPIPESVSDRWWAIAFATALCAAVALGCWTSRRRWPRAARVLGALVAIHLLGFVGFYGLYFGAPWFLARYFAPLAPLLVLPAAWLAVAAWQRVMETSLRALAYAAPVMLLAVLAFLSLRQYRAGAEHPHFQVVRWVEQNVPEETWVGAIQTGTLGFFHDRTVNLDGKVNIAAYEALLAHREGDYVVDDTEIAYLADWIGMLDWLDKPAIAEHFEVVVDDAEQNLGVLRRRD